MKKEKKDDVTAKLAALIHENGMEGVKEEYERSEEFHDRWRAKSREMLAQAEWRRRRITQRHGEETSRLNKQLEEMDQKERKAKEEGRKWEKGRDKVRRWTSRRGRSRRRTSSINGTLEVQQKQPRCVFESKTRL